MEVRREESESPQPRRRTGVFTLVRKLTALAVGVITIVVAGLTYYLASRQLAAAEAQLKNKATAYGFLVSREVRSAVAFDDQETARETFAAVAQDPDVDAMALYRQDGSLLYQQGLLSEAAQQAKRGVKDHLTVETSDRILTVAPVQSLEGPTGSLVLQMSTRSLSSMRTEILLNAVIAGTLATLIGGVFAWLTARRIAQRVGAVARAAERVAAGNLYGQPVVDTSRDELGVLAFCFNWMSGRIRDLIAEINDRAETERARLEGLVEERTAELERRNDDMRLVLSNVEQGLITIDRSARMAAERSAVLERWFGPAPESGLWWDYLEAVSPGMREWGELAWEQVTDGQLPTEAALYMLPSRVEKSGQHFDICYHAIAAETEKFLIVVSDVTAKMAREDAERQEREVAALFSKLLIDPQGVVEFYQESADLLQRIGDESADLVQLKGWLHTLKGNTGVYAVTSVASRCHELETAMEESGTKPSREGILRLISAWDAVTEKLKAAFERNRNRIALEADEYGAFQTALDNQRPHAELKEIVDSWRNERVSHRLRRFAAHAETLARQLNKDIRIAIDADATRLSRDAWLPFWGAFQHLIRNAVDHGIEPAAERERLGKPSQGLITLRCELNESHLVIAVEDDGPGIAWDKLKAQARALGRPADDAAIFAVGISSKGTATELSGRGVGMAAVAETCRKNGGKIAVHSIANQGTRIEMRWPCHVARPSSAPQSAPHISRQSA